MNGLKLYLNGKCEAIFHIAFVHNSDRIKFLFLNYELAPRFYYFHF
jgi:hypothetical protein